MVYRRPLAIALLILGGTARAESPDASRSGPCIGAVDLRAVAASLPETAELAKQLFSKNTEARADLQRRLTELNTLRQQINAYRANGPHVRLDAKLADYERRLEELTTAVHKHEQRFDAEQQQLFGPIIRKLTSAAERVREARGFTMVLRRSDAPQDSEDITVAVERELAQPSLGVRRKTDRIDSRCAALVDMGQALKQVKQAYAKEHILDAPGRPSEDTAEMIELLLTIERDEIRRENGLIFIADRNSAVATDSNVFVATQMLVARFSLRYLRIDPALLTPPIGHPPERPASDDDPDPCAELVTDVCDGARPDPRACDAATRAATRLSTAACQVATQPIELLAATASMPHDKPGDKPHAHAQRPGLHETCADLVEKVCSEHGRKSEDCKRVKAMSKTLARDGCTFILRRMGASSGKPAGAGDTAPGPLPANPF